MKWGRSTVRALQGRQAQQQLARSGVSTSKGVRRLDRKAAKLQEEVRRLDAELKALEGPVRRKRGYGGGTPPW